MIENIVRQISAIKPRSAGLFPLRALRSSAPALKRKKVKKERGRYEPNEKTAFEIHPLFFLAGVFYSLIGELPLFLMSVLVAIEHELAHALQAGRLGYRLNKVVLMPYGAVIDGDLTEVSLKDEILVAISGPICNLLTSAGFAALWWFFPVTYAYTDTACFLSLSIALVNLLPAYPLDGGRVLRSVLALLFLKSKKANSAERLAEKICKGVSVGISLSLLFAFAVLFTRGEANYTIIGFSAFLFAGSFGSKDEARYAKMNFSNLSALSRGIEIRRVAVLSASSVKSALRYLCKGYYLILEVYDSEERFLGEVRQSEFSTFFMDASIYAKIGEIVGKRAKNR